MSRITVCVILLALGVSHEILGSPLGKQNRLTVRRPSLGIINGTTASIKNYPYIASINYNDLLLGAGVILNKHWILTTAFNVAWIPVNVFKIRVGSASLTKGGQVLDVVKTVVPDEYFSGWDWNVAVLKTDKPIHFGKHVQPIKLATKDLKVGTKGKVAGWGAVDESYDPAPKLMKTTLTVSNRTTCAAWYGSDLTDRMFCTFDNETTPFWDDYGDPLVVKGLLHGLWVGPDSFNPGSEPNVFTSIPAVREWIEKAIKS